MTCVAGGRTDSGPRQINQDWLHWDVDLGIFVVADGMGGHNAGEVASHLAVETVMTFMEQSRDPRDLTWPFGLDPTQSLDANRLVTAVRLANRRVYREGMAHAAFNGMGTTLVCLLVTEDRAAFVSVGDSRIYRLRRGAAASSAASATPGTSASSAASAAPGASASSVPSAALETSAPSAASAASGTSASSVPSAAPGASAASASSVPSVASGTSASSASSASSAASGTSASSVPSVASGTSASSAASSAPSAAELLTRDDTWLAALLAADATCAAELATHPMRHVLTSVVGVSETLTPSVREERVEDGDCFLLCTDGVHGSVDVEALAGHLAGADTPEGAALAIVNLAIANGTRDNVTALVVRIR